jgi:hypothetical protein
MSNYEGRVYGSYSKGEISALPSAGVVQGAAAARGSLAQPLPSETLDESLRTLADMLNYALLWVIEIMTVVSLVAFAVLIFKATSWKPVVASMAIVAYSTVAACAGGYLILIKRQSWTRH